MEKSFNVFAGAFADETGQRFLRIMQEACDTTFEDLYMHSMPQQPARYRGCLERVSAWDMGVINDEIRRLRQRYPDMHDVFKATYITYVKSMRGTRTTKLMINMPKLDNFLHSCFVHFSKNKFVREAHYFETTSVLERRVVCMDSLRDCLFDHIGDDFVKLEDRPASDSRHGGASVVASSVVRDDATACRAETPFVDAPYDPSVVSIESANRNDLDDAETRVVSNIFENRSAVHETPTRGQDDDTGSSIGPDDSVSCADFADKQHEQLKQIRRAREIEAIPEDDQVSRTSLSLSSVSITQNGPVPKKKPPSDTSSVSQQQLSSKLKGMRAPSRGDHDAPFDVDSTHSDASRPRETLSEASMARAKKPSARRGSPPRSYVTSLEENSDE
tara:strand:- start:3839 stop:5002 length:1164 start_codon:yes stop_codon:yes gene_type:complete